MKTILLDGFLGTHSRLGRLRQNLLAANIDASIWRYDASGRIGLEELGGQLAECLRCFDGPFHAIGYSMGGLVIREALRQQPDLPLSRAAFLHTPHQGTWMGHFLPLPAVKQMRPGSSFLRNLDEFSWNVPTLNIWCPGDLIVFPGWNARWSRASHEERCDVPGHMWPLVSHRMHQRIRKFFTTDPPSPKLRKTSDKDYADNDNGQGRCGLTL